MALLRYTLLRALVFVVVGALLWLVGLRGFVLVAGALFVSGMISIFALRDSRDKVSMAWDRRLSTIKERTAAEDAWDDEQRAQAADARPADARPADTGPAEAGSETEQRRHAG
ncbi:DUF4229 domain-containing protein [Jiangella asiatica]|uniref:DUF4229 domain-containing protein n=1 Tax=Jiangella asiatica TaxID=2530372 RepID=A0A4R5DIN3_9ACTN|nr:DUF4229 domain-containing protein [Jiangella asiatica]TDE10363.1 DUF4229 domain-containing protein [Jiangella asiatica]